MIAPPLELTARLRLCAGPSVPSSDSVVAGPQLLLPAARSRPGKNGVSRQAGSA
jgi:hypothetical protein